MGSELVAALDDDRCEQCGCCLIENKEYPGEEDFLFCSAMCWAEYRQECAEGYFDDL